MVDVLLATYNGEKYLEEQLNSLLNQSYKDFRILIRDDGSKDSTLEIINKYVEQYKSKVILIEDDKKCGNAASNFMQLSKYSNAEYVMYCDQDDYWHEDKIKISVEAIEELEKEKGKDVPLLVFTKYKLVDANLNEIYLNEKNNQIFNPVLSINSLLVQNYVTGCLVIINNKLCRMMGDYDSKIPMHDWWIALIASALGSIQFLPIITMSYRQHGNNVVGATNIRSIKYICKKIFSKNIKKSMTTYINQAELFYERFESYLSGKASKIILDFIQISKEKNKIKRVKMLIKGKYLKSGIVRRIGQIIYI